MTGEYNNKSRQEACGKDRMTNGRRFPDSSRSCQVTTLGSWRGGGVFHNEIVVSLGRIFEDKMKDENDVADELTPEKTKGKAVLYL